MLVIGPYAAPGARGDRPPGNRHGLCRCREVVGRSNQLKSQRRFLGIPAFQAVQSLVESSSGEPSVDPTRD